MVECSVAWLQKFEHNLRKFGKQRKLRKLVILDIIIMLIDGSPQFSKGSVFYKTGNIRIYETLAMKTCSFRQNALSAQFLVCRSSLGQQAFPILRWSLLGHYPEASTHSPGDNCFNNDVLVWVVPAFFNSRFWLEKGWEKPTLKRPSASKQWCWWMCSYHKHLGPELPRLSDALLSDLTLWCW